MTQRNPEEQYYYDDKIDLGALTKAAVERKKFIAGMTGFITILVLIYSLTFPALYEAKTSFTLANSSSIANINKLIYTNTTKKTIFSEFLAILSTRELQEEVFIQNDFLTRFNKDNNPITDVDNFVKGAINSVKVITPIFNNEYIDLGQNQKPYELSMQGGNPEVIKDYLNLLITTAGSKTIREIIKIDQQKISIRLEEISRESKQLLDEAKQKRLNKIIQIKEEDNREIQELFNQISRARYAAKEGRKNQIVVLTDAAKLANSLGIIENNFKFYDDYSPNSDLTIAIGESNDFPDWYYYSEKALLQKIEILENRISDDAFIPELISLTNQIDTIQNNILLKTLETRGDDSPFIPRLVGLKTEKDKLISMKLSLSGSSALHIVETAKVENISINKKLIVLLAFIGSFMMSIVLALIMNSFKPDEKNPA